MSLTVNNEVLGTITIEDGPTVEVVQPVVEVVSVAEQGPAGPQGPPGTGSANYHLHDQSVAASLWSILHGFGQRPTKVAVLDLSEFEIEATVQHVDLDNIAVTFNTPVAGKAVLVG